MRIYINILFFVIVQFSSYSQELKGNAVINYKQSTAFLTNFKGPVKSSLWYYSFIKDTIPTPLAWHNDSIHQVNAKRGIMLHNRVALGGNIYHKFDEKGRLTQSVRIDVDKSYFGKSDLDYKTETLYSYDEKDWQEKSKIIMSCRQKYPVDDYEILVKPNYNVESGYDDESSLYKNKYILDHNGKIIQSQNFNYKKEPYTVMDYVYDDQNNIIKLNIKSEQKNPISFHFLDTETGFCPDLHISYEYDKKNHITQLTYIGCNDTLAFEKYEYHSSEEYITKVTRYIKSGMRGIEHVTATMVYHYNEYGNIIEKEFVKSRPEARVFASSLEFVQPTYYKYEYDKYNNWVKCYIYMEGKPEDSKPTLIAERELMYYES